MAPAGAAAPSGKDRLRCGSAWSAGPRPQRTWNGASMRSCGLRPDTAHRHDAGLERPRLHFSREFGGGLGGPQRLVVAVERDVITVDLPQFPDEIGPPARRVLHDRN